MSERLPKMRTPSIIASILNVPVHRVLYILHSRPHIQPAAKAGTTRLYDLQAVAMIRHELNAIDAKAGKGGDA